MEYGVPMALDTPAGTIPFNYPGTYEPLIVAATPKLYLRMNELYGAVAVDGSGNGNHGAYVGGPTLGAPGLLGNDPEPAVTFDGATQYVSVPDSASLKPGDVFSLGLWIRRSALGTTQTLMHKGTNSPSISFTTGNTFKLSKTSVADIVTSTVTVADTTTPHYIVVTKTGSAVKLYLDAVDVTGTVTNQTIVDTTAALEIARFTGSLYTAGTVGQVTLYNYVLTPSVVLAQFQEGMSPGPETFRLSDFQVTSPLRKSIDNVAALDGAIVGPGRRGGAFPSLQGEIVDGGDLTMRATMLDRIRSWPDSIISVEGVLRWKPTGKTERRMLVTLAEDVLTRGDYRKEFRLPLVAEDPRIYENVLNSVDSTILAAALGGTFSIPFSIPFSFGSSSSGGTATAVVGGEIATPPIIRIYGAITSPAVLNLTTGELVSFPGLSIGAGDYVEIDVSRRTALLNASPINSVTGFLDFTQSTFWLLQKGSNSIRLAGANPDANTHLTVLWRNAYR